AFQHHQWRRSSGCGHRYSSFSISYWLSEQVFSMRPILCRLTKLTTKMRVSASQIPSRQPPPMSGGSGTTFLSAPKRLIGLHHVALAHSPPTAGLALHLPVIGAILLHTFHLVGRCRYFFGSDTPISVSIKILEPAHHHLANHCTMQRLEFGD